MREKKTERREENRREEVFQILWTVVALQDPDPSVCIPLPAVSFSLFSLLLPRLRITLLEETEKRPKN